NPRLWSLIKAAGLAAYKVTGNQVLIRSGRVTLSEFWTRWREVVRQMRLSGDSDESFQSFIENRFHGDEELKKEAIWFVEGFNAADYGKISIRFLLESEQTSGNTGAQEAFRLASGYDGLCHWLAAGMDQSNAAIHLNTVVREVRWSRGHVEVVARNAIGNEFRAYVARGALITLPLGVLKSPSAVQFTPALPEKIAAVDALEMGQAVRITMKVRERFWERAEHGRGADPGDMSFIQMPGEALPTWWALSPVQVAILTGWAGGPAAERLIPGGEEMVLDRAIETLSRGFRLPRSNVDELLESWHFHDWSKDPYSLGAYTYVPVGGLDAREVLGRPADATLFFAGEATATAGANGTVHGAIASGERAAAEIYSALP